MTVRVPRKHQVGGLGVLAAFGACVVAIGCSRRSEAAAATSRTEGASAPSARPAAPLPLLDSGTPPTAAARAPAPDGCYTALGDAKNGPITLDDVARVCVAGMQPLAEAVTLQVSTASPAEHVFRVDDPRRCLRLAAAAEGVQELELAVLDAEQNVLARSALGKSFGVIDTSGPLCVDAPGAFKAVVTTQAGSGQVTLGVWQAK